MMIQVTPIVSRPKTIIKTQNSQEIGIKFTIADLSNLEKWCSGAHFVSFLIYYNCELLTISSRVLPGFCMSRFLENSCVALNSVSGHKIYFLLCWNQYQWNLSKYTSLY